MNVFSHQSNKLFLLLLLLLGIYNDVEYCFSASTVEETITRLQSISHPFAQLVLDNIVKCDPFALKVEPSLLIFIIVLVSFLLFKL